MAAQSFADTVLGGSRPSIVALTLAVALLLLIACVNIGNLSLVRLLGRTVRSPCAVPWAHAPRTSFVSSRSRTRCWARSAARSGS